MLSAAKKRRVTSSNSSFNSDDDGDPPAICDITANVSVSENNKSDFRVMYIVSFTKPCCPHPNMFRDSVLSGWCRYVLFDEGEDN